MKVILSFNEARAFKKVMESIQKGSTNDLIDSLKNNKLVTVNVDVTKQDIIVNVKEEYMIDFLAVYNKYITILITYSKEIFKTLEYFTQDTVAVVEKYTKEEEK